MIMHEAKRIADKVLRTTHGRDASEVWPMRVGDVRALAAEVMSPSGSEPTKRVTSRRGLTAKQVELLGARDGVTLPPGGI